MHLYVGICTHVPLGTGTRRGFQYSGARVTESCRLPNNVDSRELVQVGPF